MKPAMPRRFAKAQTFPPATAKFVSHPARTEFDREGRASESGAKLDVARAQDVLHGNGVLEVLRSTIALSSKWKAVRLVLEDWFA
jgi:hypothetical protein